MKNVHSYRYYYFRERGKKNEKNLRDKNTNINYINEKTKLLNNILIFINYL